MFEVVLHSEIIKTDGSLRQLKSIFEANKLNPINLDQDCKRLNKIFSELKGFFSSCHAGSRLGHYSDGYHSVIKNYLKY